MVITTPACQAYSAEIPNPYGYQPSLAAGVVFVVVFLISSCTHLFQSIRYRTIWQGMFVVGAGAETLGWIARTASSQCSYSTELFTMQISLLIFAPAWTMAGIYIILFRMVSILGSRSCPLPPKVYLWSCLGVDFLSLVMQAAGGGLAGRAFSSDVDTKPGTYTMVAGILFQLSATVAYTILMSIVFFRGFGGIQSSKSLTRLASAMAVVVSCMIARGVYRGIELLQGWQGHLNTTELYIIVLDAVLMAIAMLALNICNPGRLLAEGEAEKERNASMKVISLEEIRESSIEPGVV